MTMFKVRVNMTHVQSPEGNVSRGAGLQVEYHEEHPEALVLILHDMSKVAWRPPNRRFTRIAVFDATDDGLVWGDVPYSILKRRSLGCQRNQKTRHRSC